MNPFMRGFLDELSKHANFKEIVHHPLTQALGYAALAGEGAHALAGLQGGRAKHWAEKSTWGKRIGRGTIAGSTVFLAAEALAALSEAFKSKKEKRKRAKTGDVIINVHPPGINMPRLRIGKLPRGTSLGLRSLTHGIGFKK